MNVFVLLRLDSVQIVQQRCTYFVVNVLASKCVLNLMGEYSGAESD